MNFKQFFQQFPNQETCKNHFKSYRDNAGVTYKKCQSTEHYWLSTISYYKCKGCGPDSADVQPMLLVLKKLQTFRDLIIKNETTNYYFSNSIYNISNDHVIRMG